MTDEDRPLVLAEFFPLDASGHLKAAHQLGAYTLWISLSHEGLPRESEFRSLCPASLANYCNIYRVDPNSPDRLARCTGMGSICRERIGRDLTAGPLENVLPEGNAQDLKYRLHETTRLGRPTFTAKNMAWNGKPWINYSSLLLPLDARGGLIAVIGAMAFEDIPGYVERDRETVSQQRGRAPGARGDRDAFRSFGRAGLDRLDSAQLCREGNLPA